MVFQRVGLGGVIQQLGDGEVENILAKVVGPPVFAARSWAEPTPYLSWVWDTPDDELSPGCFGFQPNPNPPGIADGIHKTDLHLPRSLWAPLQLPLLPLSRQRLAIDQPLIGRYPALSLNHQGPGLAMLVMTIRQASTIGRQADT